MGRVRLSTSASYATHVLSSALPASAARYPAIGLDVLQTDVVIDFLAEGVDVAVRAGPLKSSNLLAGKLGEIAMMILASPGYLASHGEPRTIEDLARHRPIGFSYSRAQQG